MSNLSTKIALAALVSIATFSAADATYDHTLRNLDGDERGYNNVSVQRRARNTARDEINFAPHVGTPYHLTQHEIYGQPELRSCGGTRLAYDEDESFVEKAKNFVSAYKKPLIIGAVITTAIISSVMYFMSSTQEDEQNTAPFMPVTPTPTAPESTYPAQVFDAVLDLTSEGAKAVFRQMATASQPQETLMLADHPHNPDQTFWGRITSNVFMR